MNSEGQSIKRDVLQPLHADAPQEAKDYMGKIITISDVDSLPSHHLFRNPEVTADVDISIKNNDNIVFHPLCMRVVELGFNKTAKLLWHGRGEDGRMMILVVDNVYPLFYVRCPDGKSENEFKSDISAHVGSNGWGIPGGVSYIMRKRIMYFEPKKRMYARIQFSTIKDYYNAKKYFMALSEYIVAGAELPRNSLHLQILKEHSNLRTADPCVFKYRQNRNPIPKYLVNDVDIFLVNVEDIQPLKISIENSRPTVRDPQFPILSYDCESGSPEFGMATKWERSDTKLNDIGGILALGGKHLFRFTITTAQQTKAIPNCLVIVCRDQLEMLIAFSHIFKKLRPAIETGYNTHGFDWPFIIHKLNVLGASTMFFANIDVMISDWNWLISKFRSSGRSSTYINSCISKKYTRTREIKLASEDKSSISYPDMLSFVSVDLLPQFRRKNPGGMFSKNSLNSWLERYGKPLKYDMPYTKLHDIYVRQIAIEDGDETVDLETFSDDVTEMCLYCVFDTAAVLDLIEASGVMKDLYVLASINWCTISETSIVPIASIVLDAAILYAFRRGYLNGTLEKYSNDPRGTYPGAHVLFPKRGLIKAKLTIRELMQHFPKWKSVTNEEVEIMEKAMLHSIENPISYIKEGDLSESVTKLFEEFVNEPIRCPVVPHDFKSMYPHIMLEGNMSPEQAVKPENINEAIEAGYRLFEAKRSWGFKGNKSIHMYFVRRDNDNPETDGIIPRAQFNLLDRRNAVKADMKNIKKKIAGSTDADEIKRLNVVLASMNVRQNLLKVSMNSYYGKMKSVMYEIACETTFGGVDRLKALIQASKNIGWKNVIYGDTDSIYVEMPSHLANDLHAKYYGGKMSKKDYNHKLVERAIAKGSEITDKLNKGLRDAGYPFMTVSKEETLFPDLRICKKKYVGAAHDKHPEFNDDGTCKSYTVRKMGARLEKGSSPLAVTLGVEMYKSILNIYNTKSYSETAADIVKRAYSKFNEGGWPMKMFVNSATYRGKQNSTTNFVKRLQDEQRPDAPVMYEKFQYVFVRKDYGGYNEFGNKQSLGRAGIMELYSAVLANPDKHTIDFGIYMEKVQGGLGEVICADPKEIVMHESNDDEAMQLAAKLTTDKGKKYIEYLCNMHAGVVDSRIKKMAHVAVYKKISSIMIPKIRGHYHDVNKIYRGTSQSYEIFSNILNKMVKMEVKKMLDKIISGLKGVNLVANLRELMNASDNIFDADGICMDVVKMKKEELSSKLFDECSKLDKISENKRNILLRTVANYKNSVGLNKSIMTKEDFETVVENTKTVPISEEVVGGYEEDLDAWGRCASICREMAGFEKYIQTHKQYIIWLERQIAANTGCGISMEKADINSDAAGIMECVDASDILKL